MDEKLDELLINYKGTLSNKDQRIFLELKHYDHVNLINDDDGYIVIGKLRKKHLNGLSSNDKLVKITNHQDNQQNNQPDEHKSIDNKTNDVMKKTIINNEKVRSLDKFLKQFKQSLIKSSIFKFPLDIQLNDFIDCEYECLDPRFILLSLYHLLNQRKTTIDEFIDHNCLAITFVSLSFYDDNLRRIGYAVLVKFKQNLCSGSDSYSIIWRLILDKFAASLENDNQLIPPLIVSYLVHIIPFIKTPTYSINEQLTKFLCNYSTFKFKSIANFILSSMLMNDDLEQNSFYQDVALIILKNGIKTEADFTLCLRCKIIDFLLINYNSSLLFKQNLKIKVLDIFKLIIIQLPNACKLMCTEKAFLLWLNQLIIEEKNFDVFNKLNQIITQLNELNYDFYPLFQIELKMIKNVCIKRMDQFIDESIVE